MPQRPSRQRLSSNTHIASRSLRTQVRDSRFGRLLLYQYAEHVHGPRISFEASPERVSILVAIL